MKKILTILTAFTALPLLLCAKGPAIIGGSNYTADTIAHYKVGPGTYHTHIYFYGPKNIHAFYLEIDATNPNISFHSVLGRDSIVSCEGITNMAARKSKAGSRYFAGVNADFFATSGQIGTPVHGAAVENELAKVPPVGTPHAAFTTVNEMIVSNMTFTGQVVHGENKYTLNSVNGDRGTNHLVLYNRNIGRYTHTNAYGYEVPVALAAGETWGLNKPVKVTVTGTGAAAGNMAIAENAAVLSGHGTQTDWLKTLSAGDELTVTVALQTESGASPDIACMVGGDRKILGNGEVLDTDWAELHPRTVVGYSADNSKVFMLVVDGRQGGYSDGATTKQMADMLKFVGATDAMNLDGGGSSGLYIEKFGIMNRPSDGNERAVSNGVFVVCDAPDDNNIAEILCTLSYAQLPKNGVFTPHFMGYNQYGYLLDTNLKGVSLSCDASLGHVQGDTFIASGNASSGKLHASFNGVETVIDIYISQPENLSLRLDSVVNDGHYEYPIEVNAVVNGETLLIAPETFSWTVQDPQICSVTEGRLKGLKNGRTEVYCRLDDFADTLTVNVQIPDRRNRAIDDFADASSWTITNSALNNIAVVPTAQGTELQYTFGSGRAPYLQIAKNVNLYSLPDTMRITVNTGATEVSKIALSMKDNASRTSTLTEFENIPKNTDYTISLPMNGYFENYRDMALYPVRFQSMKFFITAASQTAGNQYAITLRDFSLVYDHITVDVPDLKTASMLRVYPNPGRAGESHLYFALPAEAVVSCTVYNLEGQMLSHHDLGRQPAGEIALPIDGVAAGTYLLKVTRDGESDTVKVIIR